MLRLRPPLLLLLLLAIASVLTPSASRAPPYAMRLSCGAQKDVHTPLTNTLWHKDFAYTGGFPANATLPSSITPPLSTLRYFPLSEGLENCYIIKGVPAGHYSVRIFFGLVVDSNFDDEPLFDVSVEGTLVDSLNVGWRAHNEQVFTEALVFLTGGTASICFHSTGRGDPAILSIEVLQIDDKAYYFGPQFGQETILKTVRRLNCGAGKPKFDVDYRGDPWGGDRYWNPLQTFGQGGDRDISVVGTINKASLAPNFYPEALYRTALVSIDTEIEPAYTIDVKPNANYSIWLHFSEIDSLITSAGKRVFDVLINGDIVFEAIDIVKMSGGRNTALVLNTTIAVNGRTMTIALRPTTDGSHAIINAIEVFQVIMAEAKTLPDEIDALQSLKKALQLPSRLGWNGDPCVPQQHPWSGADCLFDSVKGKWFIDGLGLENQGLKGYLPNSISQLSHLQNINFSGNNIHGAIASSLGSIPGLETLDLSYNSLNGSIPESLGQLNSLQILNLNGNKLSGRVPSALGGRLLHRASFNFTDNDGLCGIPGLPTCGRLSVGAKVGIAFAACIGLLLLAVCTIVWWKRQQNILRAQRIKAAREAPYAKKKTHFSHDVQLAIHPHTASENGPGLLS